MKSFLLVFFLLAATSGFSQSVIQWSPGVELDLSDFQSPQTEINEELNTLSILSGTLLDFSYQMSTYEFMFTKNFNSKVKATLNRNSAAIIAPDSAQALRLVDFGIYSFDLTELYARRFRAELYRRKGVFSDASFFMPIFNQLQEEMNAELARVMKLTDLGVNRVILDSERQQVLKEIEELANFCFECTPPKKRKKR